ncbi:hypothetical protein ACFE04_005672 [Oxalis oulophora]
MERRADTGDVHNNNNNNNVARGIIQRSLPPHGMKFVDVVLNGGGGGNESCFENFRMDKQPPTYDLPPEISTDPRFYPSFKGVAYNSNNLPDGSYHPQDAKVLFNQRHSLLRSASERIFGALKERFPILTSAPPYPLQTQVKLVVAACALHNFIRKEKPDDLIFQKYEQDSVLLQNNQQGESLSPADLEEVPMINNAEALGIVFEPENLHQSSELRDSIAMDMWDDFIRGFASM